MKPLLSYYGGKQRMIPHILPILERIPHTVYGEPFCGGSALLFAKPKKQFSDNSHYREFINDTSDLLINFYRVAVKHPEDLHLELQATLYSQSDYLRAIAICKDPDSYTDLQKAWAYFVNVNCSFAKKLNAGWGTSVIGQNSAATWSNKLLNLSDALDRIRDVHISCEDAIRCIERWDSPQTLLYVDPPYPGSHQGHYEGYTTNDWERLCDTLDNCQSSYVLSNYPQQKEPQTAQERLEIKTVCSASGQGKTGKNRDKSIKSQGLGVRERVEVIWVCDRSHKMRSDLGFSRFQQGSLLELLK